MADTTLPFEPLGEITQSPLDTGVSTPVIPDLNLAQLNMQSQLAQAPPQIDPMAKARADLQAVAAQHNGFMPHFLATMAALKGQFGPAIALQEDKRKTAIGTALLPQIGEINKLTQTGQWEDASARIEQVANAIGPKAPEMIPVFQQMMSRINDKMKTFESLKSIAALEEDALTPESPESAKRLVKALKNAAARRDYISEQQLNNALNRHKIQTQLHEGQVVQTDEASGAVAMRPMGQVAQADELRGWAGDMLMQQTGLGKDQLINVLRGQPITLAGQTQAIDPKTAQAIRDRSAMLHGIQAEMTAAEKTPITPEAALQMKMEGLSGLEISLRRRLTPQEKSALGASNTDESDLFRRVIAGIHGREIQKAEAPIVAGINLDPTMAKKAGYVFVNADPHSSDHLAEVNPMSFADYSKSGGKYQIVRTEQVDKLLRPAQNAIQGLGYINEMLANYYGQGATPLNRAETAINRKVASTLGIPTTSTITLGKAAEMIVNRAIERIAKTELVDDKTVGELKQMMTGLGADPQQSLQAAAMAAQRLQQEVGSALGKAYVPQSNIPQAFEAIQKQQQVSPPSSPAPKKTFQEKLKGLKVQ